MNVVAPAHLNIAYALLFWRIHSRPSFVQFMGELLDNRFEWWDGTLDPCEFVTERMSSALCSKGNSDLVKDLGLHKFFRGTKPTDAAIVVQELVTYIGRCRRMDYHLHTGQNPTQTYETLLEHLASNDNEEPFFHTPKSVSKFISLLAIFFHSKFAGKGFDNAPIIIYDPNPGYGEITWSMANVSNKEMNIAYTTNSVGDDTTILPTLCYRFLNKSLNEINCYNPLDSFNRIDIIATNPLHAWLPQYHGFTWKTIYDHLNALKEGAGVYVTTCPADMFNGQPLNDEERLYKKEVICGRFLKLIVKLPTHLLRGCKSAPLILVFSNVPQKHRLYYLDLKGAGVLYCRDNSREITGGEFKRLFNPHKDDDGYKGVFAYYEGDEWDGYRPMEKMRIGSLGDVNELLMDDIKLEDVFFNR